MNDDTCLPRFRCNLCGEELSSKFAIVKNGNVVQFLCHDCAIKVITKSAEEKTDEG